MNTTSEFNTSQTLTDLVPNVLATMASLTAQPDPEGGPQPGNNRVSGTIGIAGDRVTGAIYVHLPQPLAFLVVNAILGNPAEQSVSDGDLNDVVGELTNMVGGGFKSALCDADWPCAMSTPAIIRGAYAIEVAHELRAEISQFQCAGHHFTVEVHIKFN
jgi:chemotaxis protein CheX